MADRTKSRKEGERPPAAADNLAREKGLSGGVEEASKRRTDKVLPSRIGNGFACKAAEKVNVREGEQTVALV